MRPIIVLATIGVGVTAQFLPVGEDAQTLYDQRKQQIEHNIRLDTQDPPLQDGDSVDAPFCLPRLRPGVFDSSDKCTQLSFEPAKRFMLFAEKFEAYPERAMHGPSVLNTDPITRDLKSTLSIKRIAKDALGWRVGVEGSGSISALGVTPLTLKAVGEVTGLKDTTEEKSFQAEWSQACPSGFECVFESWTWHVRTTGQCLTRDPTVTCVGRREAKSLCHGDEDLICNNEIALKDKLCGAVLKSPVACSVPARFVLNGQPFVQTVFLKHRVNRRPVRRANPSLTTSAPSSNSTSNLINGGSLDGMSITVLDPMPVSASNGTELKGSGTNSTGEHGGDQR